MPIYEYKCENGHVFDVMQRMADDPLTTCIECGASVHKVMQPVGISFRGSGFYSTDYSGVSQNVPQGESKESRESKESKAKNGESKSNGSSSESSSKATEKSSSKTSSSSKSSSGD